MMLSRVCRRWRSSAAVPSFVGKYSLRLDWERAGKEVVEVCLKKMQGGGKGVVQEGVDMVRWWEQRWGGDVPGGWYEKVLDLVGEKGGGLRDIMAVVTVAVKAGKVSSALLATAMQYAYSVAPADPLPLHALYLTAVRSKLPPTSPMYTCLLKSAVIRADHKSATLWWNEARHLRPNPKPYAASAPTHAAALSILQAHVPEYQTDRSSLMILVDKAESYQQAMDYIKAIRVPKDPARLMQYFRVVFQAFVRFQKPEMIIKYRGVFGGMPGVNVEELNAIFLEALGIVTMRQCARGMAVLEKTPETAHIAGSVLPYFKKYRPSKRTWQLVSLDTLLTALATDILPDLSTTRKDPHLVTLAYIKAASLHGREDIVTALEAKGTSKALPTEIRGRLTLEYCTWLGCDPPEIDYHTDAVRAVEVARRLQKQVVRRSATPFSKQAEASPPEGAVLGVEPPEVESNETVTEAPEGVRSGMDEVPPPPEVVGDVVVQRFLQDARAVRGGGGKLLPLYTRWMKRAGDEGSQALVKAVLTEYGVDRKAGLVEGDLRVTTSIVQMLWKSKDFTSFKYAVASATRRFAPDDHLLSTTLRGCCAGYTSSPDPSWITLGMDMWNAHTTPKGFRLYTRLMELLSKFGDIDLAEKYLAEAPLVPSLGTKLDPYMVEHFENTYKVKGLTHDETVERIKVLMRR